MGISGKGSKIGRIGKVKHIAGKKKIKKQIKKAELAPASSINVSDNEDVDKSQVSKIFDQQAGAYVN